MFMEKEKAKKEKNDEKETKRVNDSKKNPEKTVKASKTAKETKKTTKKEKATEPLKEIKKAKKENIEEPVVLKKKDKEVKNEKNKKDKDTTKIKENIFKGLGIFIMVVAVLGLAFWTSKTYGSGIGAYEFNYIDIDEYLEFLDSKDKHIVYVARPSCSYCQVETPIVKRIAGKYKLDIYYLNTEEFYDSELKDYTEDGYKLINSTDTFSEGISTPNTLIVQNGKVIDGEYGYVEEDSLIDLEPIVIY